MKQFILFIIFCCMTPMVASAQTTNQDDRFTEITSFSDLEVKPTFRGASPSEFANWVSSHLVYPEIARSHGVEGCVTLKFTICEDGYLRNIEILRGVNASLDNEAIRTVSKSPKWEPGIKDGKPVNVTYTFPVIFKL